MRTPISRFLPSLCLLASALVLAGCASAPASDSPLDQIPPDALATMRPQANGDVVTEYRVAGQLRAVRVQPARGRPYWIYDRNGDGRLDRDKDTPQVYFKLFSW